MLSLDSFILLLAIQFSSLICSLQVLKIRNNEKTGSNTAWAFTEESPEAYEFTTLVDNTVNFEQLCSDQSLNRVHLVQTESPSLSHWEVNTQHKAFPQS